MTRARGLTLVETLVAAALTALLLAGAARLLLSTDALAASIGNTNVADQRAARALETVVRSIRSSSMSEVRRLDGTAFGDGESDEGIVVAAVRGWSGAAVKDAPVRFGRCGEVGSGDGELVRTEGPLQETIATDVAMFRVTRAGRTFLVEITARTGPADDRARRTHAHAVAVPRNP